MINRYIHKLGVSICLVFVPILNAISVSAIGGSSTLDFNVQEILTVSVTEPDVGANGEYDQFLRNKYTLSINTNNGNGFTASMTTKTSSTNLVNTESSSNYLPTLASSYTKSNFPTNYWGYSINDTDAGLSSSTYAGVAALGSTPNTLASSANLGSASANVYFGAKANNSKASGTYAATVVFSVVTGVIDTNNPITPVDPVTPGGSPNPSYDSGDNTTVYTSTTHSGSGSSGKTTTTTQISKGDNRSSYATPQGVTTTTTTDIGGGTPLATGLATTAAVAATTGIIFFIVAKRRKDDEEEEEDID